MRYVSIALSVEGPTDRAFLWPIVYRTALSLVNDATIQESPYFLQRGTNKARVVDICKHANEFDLFVIHADATRRRKAQIEQTIIHDIRLGVSATCKIDGSRLIGLITVCEMESWALASPDAIAKSLGFNNWPNRLRLHWDPALVETLPDPKDTLRTAFEALLQRSFDQVLLNETLEALGSRVPLNTLAALPSYQEFQDELRLSLKSIRAAI